MKKLLMATGMSVMVISACAYAQKPANGLVAGNIKSPGKNIQYLNEVNVRARRDFVSRFGDVTNEVWHTSKGSYIAVFYRDSTQYRVIYNERGDLSYIMKYYEETKLDRDVRAQIKSTYYDYKIYIVQEIIIPDNPIVYIVNLQGETDWKKISLCAGEMKVMEEYTKGK
jgi:hypothetical protein